MKRSSPYLRSTGEMSRSAVAKYDSIVKEGTHNNISPIFLQKPYGWVKKKETDDDKRDNAGHKHTDTTEPESFS